MSTRQVLRGEGMNGAQTRDRTNTRATANIIIPLVTSSTAGDHADAGSPVNGTTPGSDGIQQSTSTAQAPSNNVIVLSPDSAPTTPTLNTTATTIRPVDGRDLTPYQTAADSVESSYWDYLGTHLRRWRLLCGQQNNVTITRDLASSGLRIVVGIDELAQLAGQANTADQTQSQWLGTSIIHASLEVAIRLGQFRAKVVRDMGRAIQRPHEACDWYFAPYNPTNNHWILVGYNSQEHHLFVCDSMGNRGSFPNGRRALNSRNRGYRQPVAMLRARLTTDGILTDQDLAVYRYQSPNQPDNHSCGVMVIANAVNLMIHGTVNTQIDPLVERLNCMERLTILYQQSLLSALAPATAGQTIIATLAGGPAGVGQTLNVVLPGPGRDRSGSANDTGVAPQTTSTPADGDLNSASPPSSNPQAPTTNDMQPSERPVQWMLAGRDVHCHTLAIYNGVWDRTSGPPWIGRAETTTDTHARSTTNDMPATQAPGEESETIGGGPGTWSGNLTKDNLGSMCIDRLHVHARDAAMVIEGHRNKRQKRHAA